jgi:hypothetical protein
MEKSIFFNYLNRIQFFNFLDAFKSSVYKPADISIFYFLIFILAVVLCVVFLKKLIKNDLFFLKQKKGFLILFLIIWSSIALFVSLSIDFSVLFKDFSFFNFFDQFEFLRFNILSTILFLIGIFLLILVMPRFGMFILTVGSCFSGFAVFIKGPSTFTLLFAILTLFSACLFLFLSQNVFTGFIVNLERGILILGKNFIILFAFFFCTATLNTLAIFSFKFLTFKLITSFQGRFIYFLFAFLLNWTFNVISYFNIVFVSSLIFKKLKKEKFSVLNSLKISFKSLETICYSSLYPSFIAILKILLENIESLLSNFDRSSNILIFKILFWISKGISFVVGLFDYILESSNEVIFSYIGMYGSVSGYRKSKKSIEEVNDGEAEMDENEMDIKKGTDVAEDGQAAPFLINVQATDLNKQEFTSNFQDHHTDHSKENGTLLNHAKEYGTLADHEDVSVTDQLEQLQDNQSDYSNEGEKYLTTNEFIMFRGLKYKNWILKMISILYLTFFFFINYLPIPVFSWTNESLAIFSFKTVELLCTSNAQTTFVLLLCFNIVSSFIKAIEPAFIANYCYNKKQKLRKLINRNIQIKMKNFK